jgi:His/Glu/Gln/Arg/opine family amino acid ABC transporter permease subunit
MPYVLIASGVDWPSYAPALAQAILMTLVFTILGFTGAVVWGLVIAVMRLAPMAALRIAARVYTEIFRNLPLITEIFIIYFGLASIGIRFSPLAAGCLSLALFYGAYLSEIFRGGLQGVHKGQREAAQALGLGPLQTFWHITVPQAARLALPGTSTMLVDLLKGTSLMVTIGGAELMTQGEIIVSDTFRALDVYVVIGAIYVALAYPMSQLSLILERHLQKGTPLTPHRRRLRRLAERALQNVPSGTTTS